MFVPGKYNGVPIFDRWDGSILYIGSCLIYIADSKKETLRRHAGKAVRIDATDVEKVEFEALIRDFSYVGPAPEPEPKRKLPNLNGIELRTSHAFESGKEPPCLNIEVRNVGKEIRGVGSAWLCPILLKKKPTDVPGFHCASDGPSFGLIMGQGFWSDGDEKKPIWKAWGVTSSTRYSWSIGEENALPGAFVLKPGEKKTIRISFDLPEGEYDFFCGYGSGKCLVSNLTAFDVDKNGRAKAVRIKGREPVPQPYPPRRTKDLESRNGWRIEILRFAQNDVRLYAATFSTAP
jgi:hypothetical protein